MTTRTLAHVTLATGHVYDSPRDAVEPGVVEALRPVLVAALTGGPAPIPGFPGYTLSGGVIGDACMVTVSAQGSEGAQHDPNPIVSIAIAASADHASRLWRDLCELSTGVNSTIDPASPPPAPWCGATLYPAALAHYDQLQWIADLERCLAWTWLETEWLHHHHLPRGAR